MFFKWGKFIELCIEWKANVPRRLELEQQWVGPCIFPFDSRPSQSMSWNFPKTLGVTYDKHFILKYSVRVGMYRARAVR